MPGLISATAASVSVCESFELQNETSQMQVGDTLKQRYFSQQRAPEVDICKMSRCASVMAQDVPRFPNLFFSQVQHGAVWFPLLRKPVTMKLEDSSCWVILLWHCA